MLLVGLACPFEGSGELGFFDLVVVVNEFAGLQRGVGEVRCGGELMCVPC